MTSRYIALTLVLATLPTTGHALARYTDAAACLASLTSVGRDLPESKGIVAHVRDLGKAAVLASEPGGEARRDLLRVQDQLERIAARPQYETERGFAVTQVLEGRDAIRAYADHLEQHAAEFTKDAFARVGRSQFTLPRVILRTVRPLIVAGLGYLMFKYANGVTELTVPAIVGWAGAGVAFGGIMTHETFESVSRWLKYLSPAARATYVFRRRGERLSVYFDELRDVLKLEAPLALTKSNLDFRVLTEDVTALRGPRSEAAAVDLLAALPAARTPTDAGPVAAPVAAAPAVTRVMVETILVVDPGTRRPYAVVHVRGVHVRPDHRWSVIPDSELVPAPEEQVDDVPFAADDRARRVK